MKTEVITIKPGTKLQIPDGRLVRAMLKNDGSCELTVEPLLAREVPKDDSFVLIEASKLSLRDSFLKHKPQTGNQAWFKKDLKSAIKSGLKDFYHPIYDPSIDEFENILFIAGKRPAVGHSYDWWEKVAKEYMPERKSRLGTKNEYVAFLGVLIKKLIASGWSTEDAWWAVCDDSKMIGNYWNPENDYGESNYEGTGSRGVCGFFDLANMYKYLADDETSGFWVASGYYDDYSFFNPLAGLNYKVFRDIAYSNGVGWLVLSN